MPCICLVASKINCEIWLGVIDAPITAFQSPERRSQVAIQVVERDGRDAFAPSAASVERSCRTSRANAIECTGCAQVISVQNPKIQSADLRLFAPRAGFCPEEPSGPASVAFGRIRRASSLPWSREFVSSKVQTSSPSSSLESRPAQLSAAL